MKSKIVVNQSNLFKVIEKHSFSYFTKELYFPKFLGGKMLFKTFSFEKKIEGEKIKTYHLFVKGERKIKFMIAESLWDLEGKVMKIKWVNKTLYLYKVAIKFD